MTRKKDRCADCGDALSYRKGVTVRSPLDMTLICSECGYARTDAMKERTTMNIDITIKNLSPAEALRLIEREADEVICLDTPAILYAIGYHFRDFSQVSDDDVVVTLREARRAHVPANPSL